eukprot:CAMPEP_0116550116 /NCGR_PEP_ID=MMETSP0397-20121206/5254_1 /TAXON_ID=216820 /ORGANISM="Cyclophora tenuis, Strain ECT3854" /LENGTH=311 /DNA_ID=CAMNT_0004074923 /DNA_START=17 /DNA_END=952 /DNA_ORIENTATION=+
MSAIARQQKTKGEAYIVEAEKGLSKSSWFSNKDKKFEDAAELYGKAGNAFKVGGLYHEAGDAYKKAAELFRDKLQNSFEASKALQNAGSNYKKSSPEHAVEAYNAAILLMTDAGRVMQAAKLSKECAELYENEQIDMEDKSSAVLAIETYEQAAELFSAEDANGQASQCLAKVAELCSVVLDPPDLTRAAQLYDDLGRRCLDSNLLKFNAKGYFLQAIFCHLAQGDAVAVTQSIQRYEALDYTFGGSREGKFASQLLECVEGMDTEGFATACYEYDRVSKLDPWKTSMLVKVKRTIDDEGGEDEEDDFDLT